MLKGYKTYIGLAAAALVMLAEAVGASIPGDVPDWMDTVVGLAAIGFAWYGKRDKDRRAPDLPEAKSGPR